MQYCKFCKAKIVVRLFLSEISNMQFFFWNFANTACKAKILEKLCPEAEEHFIPPCSPPPFSTAVLSTPYQHNCTLHSLSLQLYSPHPVSTSVLSSSCQHRCTLLLLSSQLYSLPPISTAVLSTPCQSVGWVLTQLWPLLFPPLQSKVSSKLWDKRWWSRKGCLEKVPNGPSVGTFSQTIQGFSTVCQTLEYQYKPRMPGKTAWL